MKWILVGRDGVINERGRRPITRVDEFKPLKGGVEALGQLGQAGYRIALFNRESQPGKYVEHLHAIHEKLRLQVVEAGGDIDAFFWASGRQSWRTLFRDMADRLRTSLQDVPVITDSKDVITAAQCFQARALLVRTGQGKRSLAELDTNEAVLLFPDLAAAADKLVSQGERWI
jgi:D-glycero-D-manno-heptose 1,7-bisphosphate phosphatase